MEVEDFYAAALLRFGPPTRAPFRYTSRTRVRGYPLGGVTMWCQETPEGRMFTAFVRECGDAKDRAPMHYKRWQKWWHKRTGGR